jgi:hypothetical protein
MEVSFKTLFGILSSSILVRDIVVWDLHNYTASYWKASLCGTCGEQNFNRNGYRVLWYSHVSTLILILFLHCRDSPHRIVASSNVRIQISVLTISSNKKFLFICLSILVVVFPVVCYVSIILPFLHTRIPIIYHRRTYIILTIQSVCPLLLLVPVWFHGVYGTIIFSCKIQVTRCFSWFSTAPQARRLDSR